MVLNIMRIKRRASNGQSPSGKLYWKPTPTTDCSTLRREDKLLHFRDINLHQNIFQGGSTNCVSRSRNCISCKSFINIFLERKQLAGACCMHAPANVPCVIICDSIQVLASQFFVYQFARSSTQVLRCFHFDRII